MLTLQLIVATARLQLRIIIGVSSVVKTETKPGVSYDFGVFLPNSQYLGDKSDMFGGHMLLYSSSYFSTRLLYCNWMLLLPFHFIGDGATLESVPDLVKAMYLNIESFPCVRLLNLSGEIGCSSESPLYTLYSLPSSAITKTELPMSLRAMVTKMTFAVRSWK